MDEQLDYLNRLQENLKASKFYGTIIQTWQNGEVVLVKKEEVYKPRDFKVLIQISA